MTQAIFSRHFPAGERWSAYHDCVRWLESLGCSVGSMQRGAPTAVFFEPDAYVSKNRNLGDDKKNVHGWITGVGGRFKECPINFTTTAEGERFLASAQRQDEERIDTEQPQDETPA